MIMKEVNRLDDTKIENTEIHDLTDLQFAYYMGAQDYVEWGGIDCQGYFEVNLGSVKVDDLLLVWETMLRRHAMLNATLENGKIIISKELKNNFSVIDLTGIAQDKEDETLKDLRKSLSNTRFIKENMAYKGAIIQKSNNLFMFLSVNLMFIDFTSVQILMRDLYKELNGEELSKLETSFTEYLENYKQNKNIKKYNSSKKYWIEKLKGMPTYPKLSTTGRLESAEHLSTEFRRIEGYLNEDEVHQLKTLSSKFNLTFSSTLLAAYAYTLSLWSENKKFIINIPYNNRPSMGADNIVGEFTNINLLSVDFTENKNFSEVVRAIFIQLLDDLDNSAYSGVEVLRKISDLKGEKEGIAPVVFTGVLENGRKYIDIEYGSTRTPQVWIDCQVVEDKNTTKKEKTLIISWDVREGIYKKNLMDEMFNYYIGFLKNLSENNRIWIEKNEENIPTIKRFYHNVSKREGVYYIYEDFINKAKSDPEKTALIYDDIEMTYGELLFKSEKLASYIIKNVKAHKDEYLAIKMGKNHKQIIAILAVLLSGHPYIPLDINQPKKREDKILKQAKISFIIDKDFFDYAFEIENTNHYKLDNANKSEVAYAIFTSGSTGVPKGVIMSHNAVNNTLESVNQLLKLDSNDSVLTLSETSFDLSVFDIFSILGRGGTVIIPNIDRKRDPSHWAELINKYSISILNFVPAQAEMLTYYCSNNKSLDSVRTILLSGDVIKVTLPKKLSKMFPSSNIYSLGGATEGGIWSIYHKINVDVDEYPSILYGTALPNQEMVVINSNNNECQQFEIGQIAIVGYSLSEGYLNDDETTRKSFIYSEELGGKYYLTGDLGRYVNGKEIEFLGRIDNQQKINGYRVELSEIETVILSNKFIKDCRVINYKHGEKSELVAFIKEDKNHPKNFLNVNKITEFIEEEIKVLDVMKFKEYLKKAILSSVYHNIKQYSVFSSKFENLDSICKKINIKDKNKHILQKMLRYLGNEKYIKIIGDKFIDLNIDDTKNYWELLSSDEFKSVAHIEVNKYIKKHADNFCELLSGEKNALAYLFPEGRTDIAENLYDNTLISNCINKSISEIVLEQTRLNEGEFKILEVGGGVGATTLRVIESLQKNGNKNYDYLFTDISMFFLNNIKKYYPNLRTKILDLDTRLDCINDLYDVIIAAGVLNNVADINYTMSNLYKKLNEDGILVISEPIGEHIEIDVSQIFMMTSPNDSRATTLNCFFTESEWNTIFKENGFEVVYRYPMNNTLLSEFNQLLFVVKKKMKNYDYMKYYTQYIGERLPTYMIPRKIIIIDELPLTNNGKIDNRKLFDMVSDEKSIMPGNTNILNMPEIEKLIIDIYSEIGNLNVLSKVDNLREKGFDSLMLSKAAGKIIEKYGQRYDISFEQILKITLEDNNLTSIINLFQNEEGGKKLNIVKNSIKEHVTIAIKEVIGIDNIHEDQKLVDLGFDSLLFSKLAGRIIEEYGENYNVKFEEILKLLLSGSTFIEVVEYIYSHKTQINKGIELPHDKKHKRNCEAYYLVDETIEYSHDKNDLFKNISAKKIELNEVKQNFIDKSNIVLIAFSKMCYAALKIAAQNFIGGDSLKTLILIEPNSEINLDMYLGEMIVLKKNEDPIAKEKLSLRKNISFVKYSNDATLYDAINNILEKTDEK